MGPDQNGPTYTVQETIIDGKKTLILDHNDLQRLLQQNNGSAVVLHGGVSLKKAPFWNIFYLDLLVQKFQNHFSKNPLKKPKTIKN